MTTLNDQRLAHIVNRLEIPQIIAEILASGETLTDETRFSMHDILCDLPPGDIVLTIALSALKITSIYRKASAGINILHAECWRVIDTYAALDLENDDILTRALPDISEDLSGLGELLGLNTCFLSMKDQTAADLCEILAIQAGSHALIAAEFCRIMDIESQKPQRMSPGFLRARISTAQLSDQIH